jgi:hypothetical protein
MKENTSQRRNVVSDRSSINEGLAVNAPALTLDDANNVLEAISVRNIEETNKAFRRYSFDDNGGGYKGL